MKKLVVLSGAGISAESGIPTFRAADGLWEGHRIEEVASPEGWHANQEKVLEFYNMRRKNLFESVPNKAHYLIAALEGDYDVQVITQNVDNLHERGGSSKVLHLHGELMKARSTVDSNLVYTLDKWELNLGDVCEKGSQLRPHIVWFGEAVPAIEEAVYLTMKADVVIIIGTSLNVYPAAGLIDYAKENASIYVIDPKMPYITPRPNLHLIEKTGSLGMQQVFEELVKR